MTRTDGRITTRASSSVIFSTAVSQELRYQRRHGILSPVLPSSSACGTPCPFMMSSGIPPGIILGFGDTLRSAVCSISEVLQPCVQLPSSSGKPRMHRHTPNYSTGLKQRSSTCSTKTVSFLPATGVRTQRVPWLTAYSVCIMLMLRGFSAISIT